MMQEMAGERNTGKNSFIKGIKGYVSKFVYGNLQGTAFR